KLLVEPFPDTYAADAPQYSSGTRTIREVTGDSSTAYMVGTPAYLSPETLKGKAADPRCDLWSLAISLYEAMAGLNPVAGTTIQDTLHRIKLAAIPDIVGYLPDCGEDVSRFFRDALALDKNHRPATAKEMQLRLASVKL